MSSETSDPSPSSTSSLFYEKEQGLGETSTTHGRPPSERTLTSDTLQDAEKLKEASSSVEVTLAEELSFPDGGVRAWGVALGCFMLGCSCLGWGMVWGVLQDYYHTTMFPNTSLTVLSTIVGLANFTSNGSSYLFGVLGDRYGYKKMIALSCIIIYICQLASAFSTKVYQLFLFQGFFNGLGIGMGMPLYISLLSQWFKKRRGLATGLAVSGTGIGGSIQVLILRPLITALGFRKALLIHSSINAVVWVVAWTLIAERLPPNPKAKKRWLPSKVTGSFYSVAATMMIGVFGYLTPYYFSTTYTHYIVPSNASSSMKNTVPLILMNLCLGLGRISSGHLADRFGPINMFFCSFLIGGILQMLLWTFARSYGLIILFSILNGFFGCWFASLVPVVCASIFGLEGLSSITGFMFLATSPGQFTGALLSSTILSSSGNNWTAVTMFSGGMQVLGALCVIYARFQKSKLIFAKV
ncbi:MFS general substrate transporter [Dendrothele bispora CBS 962.96]|uniref:MFS general substrate transporter n=1 Tax=Dendrothele bispora (strain CBS 962.96) TaxID=1314807 RepID=A0A4S8LFA7_DENBC|nr:MFS general substrate transporter [Dendrothele bispora CBS 962.96]